MKFNFNKFSKSNRNRSAVDMRSAPSDDDGVTTRMVERDDAPRVVYSDEPMPRAAREARGERQSKGKSRETSRQPFLDETIAYMDRSAEKTKTANNYRLGFWASTMIALVLAVGLAFSQSQSRLIPFVVETNALGQPLAYKRAAEMAAPTDAVLRSQIAAVVSDLRNISSDAEYESKTVIPRVYSFLLGPAKIYADERFRGESPIVAGKTRTRLVHIDSIVRASTSSFQVDWSEENRVPHGELTDTQKMRGLFTYAMRSDVPNSSTGEDSLLINPLGLYVTQMSWDKAR